MRFTDYQLAKLKPTPGERRELTETGVAPDLRGLQLRISPAGSKTFVLRYKVGGRTRYLTLGAYPAMTLAQAHRRVQECRELLREGIDPAERQAERRAANAAAPTVQAIYEDFRDHFLRRNRKRAGNAEGVLEVHVVGREARGKLAAVEGWGARKAASITRREIIERIRDIEEADKPRVAEVAKGLVGQMFGYAVDVGLLDASPAVRIPVIGSRGEARERILSDDEIRTFWTNLATAHTMPQIKVALRLLLATGQRRQEVALARWEHIDQKARIWTIPAEHSKNGRAHQVPLSKFALALLGELDPKASSYVIPSRLVDDRPIDPLAISRAVRNNQEHFVLPQFTAHDLRRTVASGLSALGIARLHVSKVLNHSDSSVTARYDQHDYLEEKRQALDAWGRHLAAVIAGKATKVTPIGKAGQEEGGEVTKRQTLVEMQLRLGVATGKLSQDVPPLAIDHGNGETRNEAEASRAQRAGNLAGRLTALWAHWQHTRNAYFAWEAVSISVEAHTNPPAWALGAVARGMRAHLGGPQGDPAVQLGLRRRGSGRTQPVDEYRQRHELDQPMRYMRRITRGSEKPGEVLPAARMAKKKFPRLKQNAETLARYYSRDWLPLYQQITSTD